MLLSAILRIIKTQNTQTETSTYEFGTFRFEYVWEFMVDTVFGIVNKDRYFPKAKWTLPNATESMARLEPDTIMELTDRKQIFVLDAKYYRFTETEKAQNLPGSSSIGKQIIYGQYANLVNNSTTDIVYPSSTYNAFLIPDRVSSKEGRAFSCIGTATGNWIAEPKTYEIIVAIAVDTRSLLKHAENPSLKFKHALASEITNAAKLFSKSNP